MSVENRVLDKVMVAIIVPNTNVPDGQSYTRNYVEDAFLEVAGGFTRTLVSGAWLDENGVRHNDESFKYEAVIHPDDVNKFREIATTVKHVLQQKCVYLSVQSIAVEFI